MKVIPVVGNPFLATGHEMIALDIRAVIEHALAVFLYQIHEVGKYIQEDYVNTRLDKVTVPLSDTIKRNNRLTFANRADPRKSWNTET